MHELVTGGDVLINKGLWDKLPKDLQEIVRTAAQATFFRWWVAWQKQSAEAYKTLMEKHGVEIRRTPKDVLDTFLRTYDAILVPCAVNTPRVPHAASEPGKLGSTPPNWRGN
jgi:TRAP-type mannitol/chloroaromatic compound transport system substrate-binding protein